jgi:hypothetical protein
LTLDIESLAKELNIPVEELEAANAKVDQIISDLKSTERTPEQWFAITKAIEEKGLSAEMERRGALARKDVSLESFKHYYWCKYQFELPIIAYPWVNKLIWGYKNKGGVGIMAFRGATKTTVMRAFFEFIEGHRPVGNILLVQINDSAAELAGQSMADTIKYSPGWKACFPYVVPDEGRGWSVQKGYFLIDTRVVGESDFSEKNAKYGKWIQECIRDHGSEPSILTAGIESRSIVGKHPSNGLGIDDIHDENNTRSQREMSNVVAAVEANLLPVLNRPFGRPFVGMAFTPWNKKDGYQPILRMSFMQIVITPIFTFDEEGNDELNGRKGFAAWPEAYPMADIREKQLDNPVRFEQMYMCNIDAMDGQVLKAEWLREYPAEKISSSWPCYFGVDFASTADYVDLAERDYFCLAVIRAIPGGGVIVVDGVREHFTQADAETKIKALADMYKPVQIGIEKWGKGEEFLSLLTRMSSLPVIGCPYKGTPTRSKGQRFEQQMAPMFTTGRAWLADYKNKFIEHFKLEWIGWDGEKKKSRTGHDDALDSVYYAFYVSGAHLMPQPENKESLPVNREPSRRKPSPWASLGDK